MPTTTTREQKRWNEIVSDPLLSELPYKVETNAQGQIILSPHTNRHSKAQRSLQKLLDRHAPTGEVYPEFAIATSQGVKSPDVVWVSPKREREMEETGDPSTLAPEICIEVLSESNTIDEMEEKRALYRDVGAQEVWLVEQDGRIRFFGEEEMEKSTLVPDSPDQV
jgi:Uma2 family endonuclease